MYLGFDRSGYPGDAIMQSLKASTNMTFVAVYLAPAPSHGDSAWMAHVPDLKAAGWGLLPVYVGQQTSGGPGSHSLTAAQGTTDAADVAALAQTAGLDANSVVYLDIEQGGTMGPDLAAYVGGWIAGMTTTSFRAGVYCSFSNTAGQVAGIQRVPTWVFHPTDSGPTTIDLSQEAAPDPGNSGFSGAIAWQYRMSLTGSIDLTWTDSSGAAQSLTTVDLDSSLFPDPAHPDAPTPTLTGGPNSAATGDTITLTGTGLAYVIDVGFGNASIAQMVVVDDTQITFTVPDGYSGQSVTVVVTDRFGTTSQGVTISIDISPAP